MKKSCMSCMQSNWANPENATYILATNPLECECCVELVKVPSEKQSKEGTKFDSGKPKLSLLTRESLAAEARAFEYGAKKYDKNNYKKGMAWSRVIDAALRHLTAFNAGESIDSESGLCHLDHAKACLGMLVYYYENKIGKDDR